MLDKNDLDGQDQQQKSQAEQSSPQSESQSSDTHDTVVETEHEATSLQQQVEEHKDKYLRLYAEFENYKKRNAKERLDFLKLAGQDILRELLPVLDDFQRAEKAFAQDNNAENYTNGARLIFEKLQKALQSKGLKAVESIGKEFNVEYHEAIAEVPAASEDLKGKIIDEVESGYMLHDTIIRYAKVVVGK
jgi:molecular chaperone GrpE